jgi:DNA-binding response OmpR family regulator
MTTVLVVDDEPIVRDVIVRYLRRDGFATLEASSGDRARELIESEDPGLVVLDVMLPGIDGLELCRWIRGRSDLPVIMLTARGEEADRRTEQRTAPAEQLEFGELVLDAASRQLTRAGNPVALTAREFDLLWFLASNPRRVFSRGHLMDRVWGHAPALDTGTVTVHVRRLREKLEPDPARPRHLLTVWGVGYRFDP